MKHTPGQERIVLNLYTGDSILVKEGEPIPEEYILKIQHYFSSKFFKALAESLDKNNIKTDNDFKIIGLLEATKYHLEDMRKLVFNNSIGINRSKPNKEE